MVASSSKVLVEYQQLQEQAATLLARLDDAASTTQQLQQEVDLAHAAAAASESAAAVKTGAHTTALNSAAERYVPATMWIPCMESIVQKCFHSLCLGSRVNANPMF